MGIVKIWCSRYILVFICILTDCIKTMLKKIFYSAHIQNLVLIEVYTVYSHSFTNVYLLSCLREPLSHLRHLSTYKCQHSFWLAWFGNISSKFVKIWLGYFWLHLYLHGKTFSKKWKELDDRVDRFRTIQALIAHTSDTSFFGAPHQLYKFIKTHENECDIFYSYFILKVPKLHYKTDEHLANLVNEIITMCPAKRKAYINELFK